MKLNLKLFEQQVDPTILQRGLKYYRADRVDEIERSDDGKEIDFIVVGNEPYKVHISTDGDEVVDYSCDCPYDMGPVCKHVVAALFELQHDSFTEYEDITPSDSRKDIKSKSASVPKRKNITTKDIDRILDSLSPEELKSFIRNEISDRAVKMRLVSMYGEKVMPPSTETYRSQIRSIISEAGGRYGYVEYHSARMVGNSIQEILDHTQENISNGQWEAAFAKIKAVIEEAETIVSCGDDSNGYLGAAVARAFSILNNIAAGCIPEPLRTELFDYVMKNYETGFLSGWGWNINFIKAALELASDDKGLDRIEKSIPIGKYEPSSLRERDGMEIMARLLEKRYSKDAADKFIYENRANPDFRERLLQSAIDSKDYDTALRLADEGIASDDSWTALTHAWEDYKLKIYILLNDAPNIASLAQKIFLDDSNIRTDKDEIYRLIKENIPAEDWSECVANLISRIKTANRYSTFDNLKFIYIKESMWDEYFHLLTLHPDLPHLEEAEPYFKTLHHDEFISLYVESIRLFTDRNMGRSSYQQVTRYLRHLKKLGERRTADDLATELKNKYPRRRALIEELRNL